VNLKTSRVIYRIAAAPAISILVCSFYEHQLTVVFSPGNGERLIRAFPLPSQHFFFPPFFPSIFQRAVPIKG
jgi:hypothetical protein